jgi:N-acetylglucosaminyl-diphospho-decaprenol L-rhamnosyltransferase
MQAHASADMSCELSIIVVNYNTAHLLEEMFAAVEAAIGSLSVQAIVVDNASRDHSVALLRERYPGVELIANAENVGFGRANNQALARARGRYLLLLNTDAFVSAGGIERTVRYLDANPDVSVLGVRLVGRDGGLQPSCRYFPTPWNEFLVRTGLDRLFRGARLVDDMSWDHASVRECDWVPGCYLLLRKDVVDRIGLFDPRFFLYYEEVDHCRAEKVAGGKVVYFPDTTVVHIGGESAKSDAELTPGSRQISALQIESALLYYRKHHGLAGLWLGIVLTAVADALLALKWVLQRLTWRGAGAYLDHFATTWSLLRQTAWARRPTR